MYVRPSSLTVGSSRATSGTSVAPAGNGLSGWVTSSAHVAANTCSAPQVTAGSVP